MKYTLTEDVPGIGKKGMTVKCNMDSRWHTIFFILKKGGYLVPVDEFPKDGSRYWYVDSDGAISEDFLAGDKMDIFRQKSGNVFRTKAEAQAHYEKIMNREV